MTEMIKFEDDVVVEYVFGMLEDKDTPVRPSLISLALASPSQSLAQDRANELQAGGPGLSGCRGKC